MGSLELPFEGTGARASELNVKKVIYTPLFFGPLPSRHAEAGLKRGETYEVEAIKSWVHPKNGMVSYQVLVGGIWLAPFDYRWAPKTKYQLAAYSGQTPIPGMDSPLFETLREAAQASQSPRYSRAYEWRVVAVEGGSRRELTESEREELASRPQP
jgi:hypothetical protein